MESKEPTKSKYDEALAKYNTSLDDADVAAQVKAIIEQKVAENDTPEVKKFLFHCIDLTTLNTTDSDESVMRFTQNVNRFDEEFPDMKSKLKSQKFLQQWMRKLLIWKQNEKK